MAVAVANASASWLCDGTEGAVIEHHAEEATPTRPDRRTLAETLCAVAGALVGLLATAAVSR